MTHPDPGAPRRTGLPRTRAGRRRARDRRLAALRAFGTAYGFTVLGLHQDLSRRYPVDPLLGARSAQAELALTGTWEQLPALVLCALVQAEQPGRDRVVQMTVLDRGPTSRQFTATWGADGPRVVLLGPDDPDAAARATAAVAAAGRHLRVGDHVAADDVELVHTREVGDRRELDVVGPLRALAALVTTLD